MMGAKFRYLGLLLRYNLKGLSDHWRRGLASAATMLVQNILLFASWIVLFHAVGSIRGWQLPQIWLLYGLIFLSQGLALFLTEGIRHIARKVDNGELDLCLARPAHPLPQLFLDRCSPGNLGDMLCGLIFLLGPAGLPLPQIALALAAAILLALLMIGAILLYQSLAFFIRGGTQLADYLFDGIWYFSQTPQEGQGWLVKIILFTVLPAGFINIFSVALIERTAILWLGGLALVAAGYLALAVVVFNAGVKRYVWAGG